MQTKSLIESLIEKFNWNYVMEQKEIWLLQSLKNEIKFDIK